MARKNKSDFFQPGGRKFLNGDKPDQETFQDLVDSATFPKEVNDRAKETEAGLTKTTTDAKVNGRDNSDAAGISPVGFPTIVSPAQLWILKTTDPSIELKPVARQSGDPGFADAPLVEDVEINFTDTLYRITNDDLLNGAIVPIIPTYPVGNQYPHIRKIGNQVSLYGTILVPVGYSNNTQFLKIPREFLAPVTVSGNNYPFAEDLYFMVQFGGLSGRVGVTAQNILSGLPPNDWGALVFLDCRISDELAIDLEVDLVDYIRLSLNGISYNIKPLP